MCPPQINGPHSLWDFGLWEIQLLYNRFLPKHFTRSQRSNNACPLESDGCNPFGYSGFENLNSQISLLAFSRSVKTRVHDLLTCVLLQIDGPQLLWLFGLRGFQISTSLPSLSFGVFFPELHKFLPCILLAIQTFLLHIFPEFMIC
jgi:hypothetical protein